MIKWMMSRIADILLALLVMTTVIWYVLTQPMFTWGKDPDVQVGLDRQALDTSLRGLLAVPASAADAAGRFKASSAYLAEQFSVAGAVEELDRGEGQHILRLRVGKGSKKKMFVILHYVVTDKPMLEVAESTLSLVELAKALSQQEPVETQLNLTVALHHPERLSASLMEVSAYHVDQVQKSLVSGQDNPVLVFMPGLRLPEAGHASDWWHYFGLLMPSGGKDLALYGRLDDTQRIRRLKGSLYTAGFGSLGSLNIPVNLPDAPLSPLKLYWNRNLSAQLVRPNILYNDKNYNGHIRFINSLFALLKQGL